MKRFADSDAVAFNELLDSLDHLVNFIFQQKGQLPTYDGIPLEKLIPVIVVVGNQSSGKSSLLSSLTGKQLPVSSGRTTLFATEIRFRRRSPARAVVNIYHPGINGFDSEPLNQETIWKAHNYLIGVTGDEINENAKITIEIDDPECESMTFVDIPGLFPRSVDGDDSYLVPIRIAERYMNEPNCLIIQVLGANEDIAMSSSNYYVKKADPRGLRTVNVFTKIDLERGREGLLRRINDYDPEAILTISSYYVDKEFHPIDEAEERKRLSDIPHRNKGRRALLQKMKKHVNGILESHQVSIEKGLISLRNKLSAGIEEIGRRSVPEHVIHTRWINATEKLIHRLTKEAPSPHITSFSNARQDIVKSFDEKKVENIFSQNTIREELIRMATNEIPFLDGHRKIISACVKKACDVSSPEIIETINKSMDIIMELGNLIVQGTLENCQSISEEIISQMLVETREKVDDFIRIISRNLEDAHQNMTILNFDDILRSVEEMRIKPYLEMVRIIQQGENLQLLLNILSEEIKISSRFANQAQQIEVICRSYWNVRVIELKTQIFRWFAQLINDFITNYIEEISNFRDHKRICETSSIIARRDIYLQCETLVQEVIKNLH